jgi:D-arabinose 1-dehydrogenase-like Zn-dependent alcohol dehydrogenase
MLDYAPSYLTRHHSQRCVHVSNFDQVYSGLMLKAAPLTCAGTTIYGSIKTANLKPGQIIGISGLGALGHLGVQFAKAMVSVYLL